MSCFAFLPRALGLSLVMLLITTVSAESALAQSALRVIPSKSSVAIEGTSNVNSFTCVADDVDGFGRLAGEVSPRRTQGELVVPVRSFDCNNGRMSNDLFEALKGAEHPAIIFRLDGVRVIDEELDESAALLEAEGTLWVAGVGRSIQTRVMGDRLANGYLRATGALSFLMSDFDIEPPTALLGMVRVRDGVTVHFDLVATPEASVTDSSADAPGLGSSLIGEARQ